MGEKIIGYVTTLGYIYCFHCATKFFVAGAPIYERNGAHNQETCDHCKKILGA